MATSIQIPCVNFQDGHGVIEIATGSQVAVAGRLEVVDRRLCVTATPIERVRDLLLVEFHGGARHWVRSPVPAATAA